MKLLRGNKIYIQKKDLFKLLNVLNIFKNEISKDLVSKQIELSDNDYVCFTDEKIVNMLKKIDFIVDYDEANSLSEDELREYIISNINKVNLLSIKLRRVKRYDFNKKIKIDLNIDLLNEKINDLINILNEKQGRIVLNIPTNILSLNLEK